MRRHRSAKRGATRCRSDKADRPVGSELEVTSQDPRLRQALCGAVEQRTESSSALRALLEAKVSPDARLDGTPLLHYAVRMHSFAVSLDCARLLLEAKADVLAQEEERGRVRPDLALHWAVFVRNQPALVRLLLEAKASARIDARDCLHKTALMHAAAHAGPETTELLLAAGANVHEECVRLDVRTCGCVQTAVDCAIKYSNWRTLPLLYLRGALSRVDLDCFVCTKAFTWDVTRAQTVFCQTLLPVLLRCLALPQELCTLVGVYLSFHA